MLKQEKFFKKLYFSTKIKSLIFLIIFFPLFAFAQDCVNPELDGFTYQGYFEGSNYYISEFPASWLDANDFANSTGGYLVSINSLDEQNFIQTLISNYWSGNGPASCNDCTGIWFGMNDLDGDGIFTWASGEAVTYTNWNTGEPNMSGNSGQIYTPVVNNSSITGVPFYWDDTSGFEDFLCILELECEIITGCTNPDACNYNPEATEDDGSCSSISVSIDNIENNSCYNANDGSVDFTVSGGSGGLSGFEYSLTNVSDGNNFINTFFPANFSGLWAGTWELVVSEYDIFGQLIDECPGIFITITEPTPIEFDNDIDNNGVINSSFTYSNFICSNDNDGFVEFFMGGGDDPYNFDLIDNSGAVISSNSSGIFNGLSNGCYDVNIFDSNYTSSSPDFCISSVSFCIDADDPVISNPSINPAGCAVDGFSEFFLQGLTPFNVFVYVDNTLYAQELNYSSNNILFENLPTGAIEVVLEDGIGCSTNYEFDLQNVFNEIEIINNEVTNPSCTNSLGSVDIQFSNTINIYDSGIFGTLSISEDLNNNCVVDEPLLINILNIPNNGNNDISILISDLEAADYVYVIEDSFGCQASSCFTISNDFLNPDPNVFFGFEDATCFNASGSAYVSLDPNDIGGVPFDSPPYYDVVWLDENGNEIQTISSNDELLASSLYAGDYTIIITDANNCDFEYPFTISQPPLALDPGISYDDVSCNGACNGEIVIQPVGGVNDYYSINVSGPGVNIDDVLVPGLNDTYLIDDLCPGEYIISVDDNICEPVIETIIIAEPDPIEWTVTTEPLPCFGDVIVWSDDILIDNGNDYVFEGGTGPADLYWYNSPQSCSNLDINASLDINNLGSGSYYLYSVDANGCCTNQGQYTIPVTPPLESDFNIYDSELWIYCPGDNTGIIALNTYGGTPADGPYTYLWEYNGDYISDYDNMNVVENLSIGEYQVTVNDENECGPIIHTVVIAESDPIEFYIEDQSDFNGYGISCNGNSDGFININTNTPANYNYNWVTVDSNNNIIAQEDYEINISYVYTWTDQDGNEVEANTQGGLEDISAGTYNLSVQVDIPEDESLIQSCIYTDQIQIVEPSILTASLDNATDITCYGEIDGNIFISVSGGAGNYSYSWSNGATSQDLQNIGVGTYSVTITDQNNCSITLNDVATIIEPDVFEFDITLETINSFVSPALCEYGNSASGQIEIDVDFLNSFITGGTLPYNNPVLSDINGSSLSGDIVNNIITFDNLEGGDYIVTVQDAEGCEVFFNINVPIDNTDPIDFASQLLAPECGSEAGSIFITDIFNGYPPYSISITNIDNPTLFYNFTTEDDFDSFDFDSNDWNNNGIDDYDQDIDGDNLINQFDGDIDGDGIANYLDNSIYGSVNGDEDGDGILNIDPDFNPNNYGWYQSVIPGTYEIIVTDANGCESDVIFEDMDPVESESFEIFEVAGSCYVELEDNTCSSLTNNGSIEIDPNSISIPTLYPFIITVDGQPYDVISDWGIDNDGNFENYIIPNLDAGTVYTITLMNGNGCYYDMENYEDNIVEVPILSELDIEIIGFCPECQDTDNGGFAYNLLPVSYLDSPSSSYSLDIFYTDDNVSECLSDIDSDGIINCNDPDMDGDGIEDIFEDLDLDGYYDNNNYCSEPFIDLNNDGWCNFNEVTCDSAVCVYSCNATDPNSWTAFGNAYDPDIDGDGIFDIDGDDIPNNLDSDMDGDDIPNDEDPDIDGDGILNLDLSGSPDEYITITNSDGEEEVVNNPDYNPNYGQADLYPFGTDLCISNCNEDDDLDVDNDGVINELDLDLDGVLYDCNNVTNSSYTNINTNDQLLDGYYSVDQEYLLNIPDPNVLPNYHEDYIANLEMNYDQVIGGLAYGTYFITVIDEYGCQFTEEIDLSNETCESEFGATQWENCLFIPSVFTPNSDGINDLWDIYNIEIYEPGVSVKIFNRWGQIVYDNGYTDMYSDDLWDGRNTNGKEVEIATYYYVVEVEVPNSGEMKNYTGYVVVKR